MRSLARPQGNTRGPHGAWGQVRGHGAFEWPRGNMRMVRWGGAKHARTPRDDNLVHVRVGPLPRIQDGTDDVIQGGLHAARQLQPHRRQRHPGVAVVVRNLRQGAGGTKCKAGYAVSDAIRGATTVTHTVDAAHWWQLQWKQG